MSHCAHDLTLEARGHQAEEDTNRAHTTVGFPVVQLNTVQKQFVATRKVPQGAIEQSQDEPFAPTVWEAEADCQRVVSL